jgi:hypothetical protein
VRTSEDQERVNEGVGLDQGAIQIHAQRSHACRLCFWLGEDLGQCLPRVRAPAPTNLRVQVRLKCRGWLAETRRRYEQAFAGIGMNLVDR